MMLFRTSIELPLFSTLRVGLMEVGGVIRSSHFEFLISHAFSVSSSRQLARVQNASDLFTSSMKRSKDAKLRLQFWTLVRRPANT
jgi:hypothetical protein